MVLPTFFMTAKPYAFFVRYSVHFQGKKIRRIVFIFRIGSSYQPNQHQLWLAYSTFSAIRNFEWNNFVLVWSLDSIKKFFGLCWCLGNDIMEVLSPALSPLASSRDNQSNFQTPFFLRNISLKLLSGAEMKHNFLKLHMRKSTIHLARLKSILS